MSVENAIHTIKSRFYFNFWHSFKISCVFILLYDLFQRMRHSFFLVQGHCCSLFISFISIITTHAYSMIITHMILFKMKRKFGLMSCLITIRLYRCTNSYLILLKTFLQTTFVAANRPEHMEFDINV